jgi:hypothetical protein
MELVTGGESYDSNSPHAIVSLESGQADNFRNGLPASADHRKTKTLASARFLFLKTSDPNCDQLQVRTDRLLALLVARCALQMPPPSLGQMAVSKYFFSIQTGRSRARDPRCEANHLERQNAVPVHVDLVPLQTVTGGSGMRVMIVVPSFTEGQ